LVAAGGGSPGGGSASTGAVVGGGGATGGGSVGAGGASSHDCNDPGEGWLFCEDFEGMAAGYEAWRQSWGWTDQIGADDPGRMTASSDAHAGGWAVHYPAAATAEHQGADLIWRPCIGSNETGCELESHDQLYFRTYLKLAP